MWMWFWLFLYSMEVADEQNLSSRRRASRELFDVLSISQFSLLSPSLSLSLLSLVHRHFLASHPNPPLVHTRTSSHTHTHTHMLIRSWTFSSKNKHFQAGTCKNILHMDYILPVSTLSCRSVRVDMQEVNNMPELRIIIIHCTPAPNYTYHPHE